MSDVLAKLKALAEKAIETDTVGDFRRFMDVMRPATALALLELLEFYKRHARLYADNQNDYVANLDKEAALLKRIEDGL